MILGFTIFSLYAPFVTNELKNLTPELLLLIIFLSVIGISKSSVAVIVPIAGSSPTLFALLAFFVFKESITKQQILGIVTTLVGIVFLSIFSI